MNLGTRTAVVAAYAGMCLIWGTTWLAIKAGLHALSPLTGVGLRFIIAGCLLYAVALATGMNRKDTPWRLVLVMAALMFGLNYVLTYTAETRLDSGLVSVLFGTLPFFSFAFGHVMIGERADARVWIGATLAFAGVAVISLAGQVRGAPLYALCAIGAACTAAFANVYAKKHSHHPPLVTLPPAMTLSGIAVFGLGLLLERTDWHVATAPRSLAALLYLAVFGSGIAFFLMMWLIARIPAWTVALSSLIFPVIAIAVGVLFGGEHFSLRELAGSALVVAGIYLAVIRGDP